MKRILLAVILVALLSTAVVTLAVAATNYVLAPSRAHLELPAAQTNAAVYTDDVRPVDSGQQVSGQARENCPFHSNAAASDSSPAY